MTSTFTRTPRTLLEQRRNLCKNPRVGVDLTGFTVAASGGATLSLSRATGVGAPGGVSSAARAQLTSAAATFWSCTWAAAAVVAGVEYTHSAYLFSNTSGRTVRVEIGWYDVSNTIISQVAPGATAIAASTWERRSATGVAPAGAVTARLTTVVTNGGAIGNNILTTEILFEAAATAGVYFDGATPDASPIFYQWGGTADASESTQNVLNPADIVVPILVNGYEGKRQARTVVHRHANTDNVSVSLIPAGPRSGTLELLFEDATDAAATLALFGYASLFLLADDDLPEIDMMFAVTEGDLSANLDDETRSVWLVKVPFVEVPS